MSENFSLVVLRTGMIRICLHLYFHNDKLNDEKRQIQDNLRDILPVLFIINKL